VRLDAGALERDAPVGHLRVAAKVAPRVTGDAKDDLEEPRARTMSAVDELPEAPVGHHEDFLRPVLGVGLGHTEPAQVAPNKINVGIVHGPECAFAPVALGAHRHRDRL
jgi:hypothetical protein